MGQGGEIFVLDMGEPVKVRPGEKLFEELSLRGEEIAKSRHPKIYIGNISGRTTEDLDAALARMSALAESGSPGEIREFLTAFHPEARLDAALARMSALAAAGGRSWGPSEGASRRLSRVLFCS